MAAANKKRPRKRRLPPKEKNGVLLAVKGALLAGAATIFAMLFLAVLMKFGILGEEAIPTVNQVLKVAGILFAAWLALKHPAERPWFRGLLAGGFYMALSLVVSMIVTKTLGLALTMLFDLLMGCAIGALCGLIFGKKALPVKEGAPGKTPRAA